MRRSKVNIMLRLAGLAKPLLHIMIIAVTMGVVGFLCAEFITILGGYAALNIMGFETEMTLGGIFLLLGIIALLRGILHYAEQYSNHYIAFRLLAILRDKVFKKLRELCPAKLECRNKGSLISVITTDIELLEVFYAHTISPIMIAVVMSVIMVIFIGSYHAVLGAVAAAAYLFVGAAVPVIISKSCGRNAEEFRKESGNLSSFVLETLYGISEVIQYGIGNQRISEIKRRTERLSEKESRLKRSEGINSAITTVALVIFPLIMLAAAGTLYSARAVGFDGVLIPTVALFSSFGPVIALANLGGGYSRPLRRRTGYWIFLTSSPLCRKFTAVLM